MTVKAHVRDNKTGVERTVMPKAYALIPKRYTLLGYVDENMNPVDGPEIQVKSKTVQKKRDVEPAVNRPKMTPEQIEAKKAELRQMNADAIQKVKDEQAAKEGENQPRTGPHIEVTVDHVGLPEVKERKKPGPKPKIKNEA